jgi:predicted hotdog family 3-hydroxylacyl-ACP dehydratase
MIHDLQIESLIPHRDRMKLIETIVSVDREKAVSIATVNEQWPLYQDGAVSPIVLIELAAQTAGICIGWKERIENDFQDGGKGWIVGIKQAIFHVDELPVSSQIITCSEVELKHRNYAVFRGTSTIKSIIVGEINIQVFRPD